MDIYTDPSSNTYRLGRTFNFLTENGPVSAFAVATSISSLIVAAYAVLIQFLFAGIWQTVASVALKFFPLRRRTQYIGLIAFWNADDPWTALWAMSKYNLNLLPKCIGGTRMSLNNLFGGICLWLLAAIVAFGGLVSSLLFSKFLVIGNAAPVHPDAVFLPRITGTTYAESARMNALFAPCVLRALGSTEAVDKISISNRVYIKQDVLSSPRSSEPKERISYSYNITSEDFGLQNIPGLSYRTRGSCVTEYGWLFHNGLETGMDIYQAWGNDNMTLPTGVQKILEFQFSVPWPYFIALTAGVSSLKSYTGSILGNIMDANTVSMKADIERLIYASFLASRDAFRETTMLEQGINVENLVIDPQKNILPGATDFNLRSGAITTLSFTALIIAPSICLGVWLIAAILSCSRRMKPSLLRKESPDASVGTGSAPGDYKARAAALRATQLYRMLDETIALDGNLIWRGRRRDVPLPLNDHEDITNVPIYAFDSDQYGTGVCIHHAGK